SERSLQFSFQREKQNHIFRRARRLQLSTQPNAHSVRDAPCDFVVFPYAGEFGIPNAVSETIQGSGGTRMGIGTDNHLAWKRDFFTHNGVADSRTSARCCSVKPNTKFFGNAFLTFPQVPNSG